MINKQLVASIYPKLKTAILSIDVNVVADVYALSFWISSEDDDPRKPILTVGYNTISKWKSSNDSASSTSEAKWNFAFWLQNETLLIDNNIHPPLAEWIRSLPEYYTDEQQRNDFEATLPLGDLLYGQFISFVVCLAQDLHGNGIIKTKFGHEIPIIIHELEYHEGPVRWTKSGNPTGLPIKFEEWVKSLG